MKIKLDPKITRAIGRAGLQLRKYSPEILMTVGVLGFIGTVVLASKATLKLKPIISNHNDELEEIEFDLSEALAKAPSARPPKMEREYARNVATVYLNTGKELALLYGPAAILGIGTIGSFFGVYGVMSSRNASLTAAYSVVQTTFNEYRKRVIADQGKDVDQSTMRSIAEELKKRKNINKKRRNPKDYDSPYAKFFDETSIHYKRDPYYNLQFLQSQQNYANELLRANGHLFLNQVYHMLGLPDTTAGAICGWVYSSRQEADWIGDNYVDFGISTPKNNAFVIGQEPSVLLDFNVDGEIYQLI